MDSAGCHPARFTLERRPTDFDQDRRVTPFTGSCCCCCCLHWVGAAIGGVAGISRGWKSGADIEVAEGTPLGPESRTALAVGIGLGVAGTIVGIAVLATGGARLRDLAEGVGATLLFAPCLLAVSVAGPVVLTTRVQRAMRRAAVRRDLLAARAQNAALAPPADSAYRARARPATLTNQELAPFTAFCAGCWAELDDPLATRCSTCDRAVDVPAVRGPRFAVRVAGRIFLYAVGLSLAGTVLGYVVMVGLALVFK